MHEHEVEPSAEFVADLAKMGNALESQPLVKADRGTRPRRRLHLPQ